MNGKPAARLGNNSFLSGTDLFPTPAHALEITKIDFQWGFFSSACSTIRCLEKTTFQCLDSSWKNRTVLRKNVGREGVSQFCLHKVNKNVKGGRNWTFCYNKSQIHIEWMSTRQVLIRVDPGYPGGGSWGSWSLPDVPLLFCRLLFCAVTKPYDLATDLESRWPTCVVSCRQFSFSCVLFLFTSRKHAVDFTKIFLT